MTGLYPQHNGSTEFNPLKNETITLSSLLKKHGYLTSIIGKIYHYKPDSAYQWHENHDYTESFLSIIQKTLKNKPYFLSINMPHPHRPFKKSEVRKITMPNFLKNNKETNEEIVDYMATLAIADTMLGEILNVLNDDDIIILTSDHGMSFPYVKGNCYGVSTNIPMIFKNKNILTKHDKENLISHVDFLPTICEWLEIDGGKLDGKSYFKTLKTGEPFENDFVYAQLNRMFNGPPCRMRSAISKDHSYVINIDQSYDAVHVDGWGWEKSMRNSDTSLFYRPKEEFKRHSGLNMYDGEDIELKQKMKTHLLKSMQKYDDPEYIVTLRQLRERIKM